MNEEVILDRARNSEPACTINPKAEASKWNSAIIHLIIYTCAFPTMTYHLRKRHMGQHISKNILMFGPMSVFCLMFLLAGKCA